MRIKITKLPNKQVGGQQPYPGYCPDGYYMDETGQCVPNTGFGSNGPQNMNPTQIQQKGTPITGAINPAGQRIGGTGAVVNAQGFQNANPAQSMAAQPKKRNPFDWNKFADVTASIGNNLTNFIGGAGAIADVFSNQQAMRSQNKWIHQQMLNTNAVNPIRDRGDYDINTGVFRPDDYVVNKGMYSNKFYSEYGGPIFQVGGEFYNPIGEGLDPSYTPMNPILVPPSGGSTPYAPLGDGLPEQGTGSIRDVIAKKESSGNYQALPWLDKKHTKLASSAVGKYQFLWNKHKDWISNVTGVKTKQEFLNNPDAQERAFDHWEKNTLTPKAEEIKRELNLNLPLDKIKYAIHFSGPQGAYDYFRSGKITKDAFGSTTKSYAKLQLGGQNDNTMKIRIVGTPQMKEGGQAYGSQSGWGLYLNQSKIYDAPTGPYENPSSTVSQDPDANPEDFVLEAEGKEHIAYPDGTKSAISGPDHSQGGVKLTDDQAPKGSFIYSKTKSMRIKDPEVLTHFNMPAGKGASPAKIAQKFNVNKFKGILDDPNADPIAKKTAKMMFEGWNKKLAELALIQEAMKGFPNGIPEKAKSLMPPEMSGAEGEEAPMMAKFGGGIPTYQIGASVQGVTAGNINDIGGVGNMVAGRNIKTWSGDKIENKDNYSRMLPAEIAAKVKALGYTGPLDTPSIMRWLYNSSPENRKVIDDLHQLHPGNKGGVFNDVNGQPTYKWGYRWDMALNKMVPASAPTPNVPVSQSTPITKQNVPPVAPREEEPIQAAGPVPNSVNPAKAQRQRGIGQLPFFSYDMFVGPEQEKVYAAPLHAEIPMPTFYDPTRQLGQNSENASMITNVMGQYAAPQSLGARFSAIQGKLAAEQANVLGNNNNLNVGVANQFAPLQTGIINHENEYNADRADKLFYNQEQTKKDFRNQLRKWFGKAGQLAKNNYNIRSNTKMLNAANPYFNINYGPRNANINFNEGVDAYGAITGQYGAPGANVQTGPTPEQYATQMQSWKTTYPGLEQAALQNMWNMKYPGQAKAARGSNAMQQWLQMAMQNQQTSQGYDVNSLWDQ